VTERGFGSGIPKLAEELGGKVTDFAASLGASPRVAAGLGAGANVLTQGIPIALTSASAANTPSVLQPLARWLMQSAVKPGAAHRASGDAVKALDTMLHEGIKPTTGGMEKAANIVSKLNKQVE